MITGGFFRVSRDVLEWELIDDPKAVLVLFRLFASVNFHGLVKHVLHFEILQII